MHALVQVTRPVRARATDGVRLGTGFWYAVGGRPQLVTSRHVVEGAVVEGVRGVRMHPDPEVDLALLDVPEPPLAWLEPEDVADHEVLSPVERVLVPGHPLGLGGERPIVRSGITATDPRSPWRGQAAFLVDVPCYPGTSGAPVLRHHGDRISLLGVIVGGPSLREDAREGILQDWPRGDTFHLGIALDARRLWALS